DTHERVRQPVAMRHTQVTEPGAFGSYVGRLDLDVENGRVVKSAYQLVPVEADELPADPAVASAIERAKAPYRKQLSRVLGRLSAPVARYSVVESPFDNLVADAVREATGVDFAVSNGFRFGTPKPAGDFTVADLFDYLPVDSNLKTGEVTGRQVRDWLEQELENVFAVDATKRFGGWLVRPSGLTFTFDSRKLRGQRLLEVTIGGKPLDPDRSYTMAACEREGDAPDTLCRLRGAKHPRVHKTTIHQAVAVFFQKHSPVTPRLEQRARAVDLPSVLRTQGGAPDYDFW
ncbi:MAG: bifunctional metallophosphatase/5'-nucleotidase, partial [Candidatus Sericytochromatia bacterium]